MLIISMLGPEICKPPFENKRDCYRQVVQYMKGGDESRGKILCLYGLRRTGKSVMMQQYVSEMSQDEKEHTAFISCTRNSRIDMDDLYDAMQALHAQGIINFFIDEVTSLRRFCTRSADLADIYAGTYGGRVVISGAESLAMKFASYEALRDKAVFVNTSYVPYCEYHRLVGEAFNTYIGYGGTLSDIYSNPDYDNPCDAYIGAAIVSNIGRSILFAGDGRSTPWPTLIDTENPRGLWNTVEKIIDGLCDQVLLGKPLGNYSDIGEPEMIDEIIGYLRDLGLLISIPRYRSLKRHDRVQNLEVLLHPGMIYARARHLIESFDAAIWPETGEELTWDEFKRKCTQLEGAAGRRIMEHAVLADAFKTLTADRADSGRFYVSLLPDSNRETGLAEEDYLIVVDLKENKSFLFEILYSERPSPRRAEQLEDFDFRSRIYVEKNFAPIEKMGIIYAGPPCTCGSTQYVNVEDFQVKLYSQSQRR